MSSSALPPPAVVFVAIVAAAAVVAMAAAIHKVYSGRGRIQDLESTDNVFMNYSNEQIQYMRDVRVRGQLQAYGMAPAYEEAYEAPHSQIARPVSRGDTFTTYN